MCDEDITSFKQRFKGIENFLRRVAFNLGNTASQTEVKIISCIPIDVSDLQQKIVNLEKELQGYKKGSKQNACKVENAEKTTTFNASIPETCVKNTEICNSKIKIAESQRSKANKPINSNICPLKQESNISFVFSALSLGSCGQNTKTIEDIHCAKQSTQRSRRGNIFRRKAKKSCPDEIKQKTNLVYYANAMKSPFLSENFEQQEMPRRTTDIFATHLANIVRKQYDPRLGLDAFSDTSQFTKPVCRNSNSPIRCDSDVCSCCYGRFQNVDNYMGIGVDFLIDQNRSYITSNGMNKTYYDSKFYDVIPVKDMSSSEEKYKKEVTKTYNCKGINRPEAPRNKLRINPITLNYRAEVYPSRRRHQTRFKTNNDEPLPSHSKGHKHFQIDSKIHDDTSKSFSVNCGSIYTKRMLSPKLTIRHDKAMLNQRESRITVNINSKDNLGKISKSIQLEMDLFNDTKTETMLDQIKDLLQSVLTEVKTNNQQVKVETRKRDAIVQKGPSEKGVHACSKVLNNFTYPTSNLAASYYTPYSQGYVPYSILGLNNYPCQQVTQNSPYFMQSCQGRCKCFYQNKNNSFSSCEPSAPVTVATNTSDDNVATTETSNLIKDIYKSVALDLNNTTTLHYDTAHSDNMKFKRSETDLRSVYDSEVLKSDKGVEALLSMCTETCSQSEEIENTESVTAKRDCVERSKKHLYHLYRLEENNRRIDNIREQDDSLSKAESDSTVVSQSVNENISLKGKKGFFRRFVKFLRRRRAYRHDNNVEENGESSENSETDDYETTSIYSRSATQSHNNHTQLPRQGYAKKTPGINIQVNGRRIGRFASTEQGNRRSCKDLGSGVKELRYNSLYRPGTSRSVRCQDSPYRRHYEARSVIVDNRGSDDHCQNNKNTTEKIALLKKHKLGLRCGEQWKNLILDN